jgi:hypothetical protein
VLDDHGRPIIDPVPNIKTPEQGPQPACGVLQVVNLTYLAAFVAKIAILRLRFPSIPLNSVGEALGDRSGICPRAVEVERKTHEVYDSRTEIGCSEGY